MPADAPARLTSLHRLVFTALMAALIAIGAYIHFPLGPVPVSLQTLFVILAGFILGPVGGAVSALLYILGGVLGLPIFSGGRAGLGHLLGPTGGYIFGFVLAAAAAGLAAKARNGAMPFWRGLLWGGIGFLLIYAVGLTWLKTTLSLDWIKAMTVGFFPFLPGDAVKLVLAVLAYKFLQNKRLLPS
jgi:biotin transport system substrate-specific component